MLQSFRDPDGSLHDDGHAIRRHVQPHARKQVERLLASGLYADLCRQGLLVPAETCEPSADGGLWLRHPRIAIPCHPFEWTPSMLGAAAELTLEVQRRAWAAGWTLKDAAVQNVLFQGSQPVFCDLLSLRERHPGEPPIWEAYGQFVRHFVLTLLVIREQGRTPRDIFLAQRDGLRAIDVVPRLPWLRYWSLGMILHVRLPGWLERRRGMNAAVPRRRAAKTPSADSTPWLLRNLGRCVQRLLAGSASLSTWSDYTRNRDHYEAAMLAEKHRVVSDVLAQGIFRAVLDIGANTGEFSQLALASGATVTALDEDIQALDALFRRTQAARAPLLCLHANAARPSPATGWRCAETRALTERLAGRHDLVLALAVLHHLMVSERLPVDEILAQFADYTRDTLLLEFVGRDDPRFVELVGANEALYRAWDEATLLKAAAPYFELQARHPLGPHRVLFQLRRRPPQA